jgi:hypothetical protein
MGSHPLVKIVLRLQHPLERLKSCLKSKSTCFEIASLPWARTDRLQQREPFRSDVPGIEELRVAAGMAFLGFGRNWLPEDLDTGLAMNCDAAVNWSSSSRAFQRTEDTGTQDSRVRALCHFRSRFLDAVRPLVESNRRIRIRPTFSAI